MLCDNCTYTVLYTERLVNSIPDRRRKVSKHGRRKKNKNRATARRLRDYEKTYVTAGGGMLGGGISGSCRLLYDTHRRSAYEPPTNPLPVRQLALQSLSSSGTMFIDPDPLCPSHGHLCRTQEHTRHGSRYHPSTHSLLVDNWNNADAVEPTKGAGSEPRCPGCDGPFTAADVCHCDCTRPDVAADVDRPSTLPSPPALDGGSGVTLPTPPPASMLQTDDLKLQKTRRKSVAGTNATSTPAVVAARKQSAATMPLHTTDDSSATAARHRAGEVEPLLVTAAVPYDDDEDEAVDDVGQLTSPLRAIGNAICRNVEQRTDYVGDVTRTVT